MVSSQKNFRGNLRFLMAPKRVGLSFSFSDI